MYTVYIYIVYIYAYSVYIYVYIYILLCIYILRIFIECSNMFIIHLANVMMTFFHHVSLLRFPGCDYSLVRLSFFFKCSYVRRHWCCHLHFTCPKESGALIHVRKTCDTSAHLGCDPLISLGTFRIKKQLENKNWSVFFS